ncbi:hypothetical protein FGG08_007242 [Glutinoglossum americanum]|uniref:Uncharacterized protein n=1 Tax=Glutinoglossum americanum TaxID=1670608 RepID=A0A9P8KZK6_9PEZI|nr:hypothetical protein FGG08_007242 [Glutinoglossum americanum]
MPVSPPTIVVRSPQATPEITAANTAGSNVSSHAYQMLLFNSTQSLATSTVVLTIFNTIAAFLTMTIIIHDCWRAFRAKNQGFEKRKLYFLTNIHPAETFPLIVSVAVIIQGFIFAGVESMGLSKFRVSGCTKISEVVWTGMLPETAVMSSMKGRTLTAFTTAIWLVPITIKVFAAETAIRALRNPRFPPRGRKTIPACLAAILILIVVMWAPSRIYPAEDRCIASLMFYIRSKGKAGVVSILCIAGVIIISLVITLVQLSRNVQIRKDERIAASRMVYYLAITVAILGFAIPYFAERARHKNSNLANMMATVSLNLWGLTNSFLHLFLRANAKSTAIKPSAASWSRQNRQAIFRPSELTLARTSTEISMVRESKSQESGQSETEKSNLPTFPPPLKSPSGMGAYAPFRNAWSARNLISRKPTTPEAIAKQPTPSRPRTPSYSIFPKASPPPPPMPPLPQLRQSTTTPDAPADVNYHDTSATTGIAITYDDLTPPPRTAHSRGSSASSATVQIGLRISNAIAMGLNSTLSTTIFPEPAPIPAPLRVPGAQKMLPPTPRGEKRSLLRLPEAAVMTKSVGVREQARASRPGGMWI